MHAQHRKGFTIVELLVVITIIVVLISLLAPAMDKAIYQAELAKCAVHAKGVATGSTTYTLDNRRHYPTRPAYSEQTILIGATHGAYDLRRVVAGHIPTQMFLCPLAGEVDLTDTDTDTTVYGGFSYYGGWGYTGMKGMNKLGDRWEWQYNGPIMRFSLLVSDRDAVGYGSGRLQASHQDKDRYTHWNVQCENNTNNPWGSKLSLAMWWTNKGFARGPVDRNFGYADNSVARHTDIELDSSGYPKSESFTTVGVRSGHETNGTWHEVLPSEGQ